MAGEETGAVPAMAVAQIALNTLDLPGNLQLYADLFGFANAGGNALWGAALKLHDLPPGARGIVWWMLGSQPFFQLEFFHFTSPPPKALPENWNPSVPGWTRFGVGVADLDRVAAGLARWHVPLLGRHDGGGGDPRRLGFRDPFAGVIVEAIERRGTRGPAIEYVTQAVTDLDAARRLHGSVMGAPILPLETLHLPADEALWDMAGTQREGFVAGYSGIPVEVVRYADHIGQLAGRSLIDQGIPNVAFASRDMAAATACIARLRADGHQQTGLFEGRGFVASYFVDPGCEIEILAVPPQADAAYGFVAAQPFFGAIAG